MLKPVSALLSSINFLNCSNEIFYKCSDAISKLSFKDEKFFERIRPICWIADSFQSNVLVWANPPPKDFVKLTEDMVAFPPVKEYGFSLFTIN